MTRDTNRAQLYDPTTGRFAETGAPTTTDAGSLTVLPDGRVLLAGDALRVSDSRAEIYDPSSGTFTPLPGSPGTPSEVLVLADGRSLFAGVDDIRWILTCRSLYSGTWTTSSASGWLRRACRWPSSTAASSWSELRSCR